MKTIGMIVMFCLHGLVFAQSAEVYQKCNCYISASKLMDIFPFTDAQKVKVQDLQQAYLSERNEVTASLAQIALDYKALLKQEPMDEAKLKALSDKKITLISQKMHASANIELELYKLLSPEQKKYWQDIFDTKLD